MLEPPNIDENALLATVRAEYGIVPVGLTFLPIGNDSATWVYRLEAVSGEIFLKLRRGPANEASYRVPRFLADCGLTTIVAPLETSTGALWVNLEDFTLALYPFVDGVTGTDAGMTERHWMTYGETLRHLHETVLPPEIARLIRHDSFAPDPRGAIARLDAHISTQTFIQPSQRDLAAFWRNRRSEILRLLDRATTLGRQLQSADLPSVLCHADIHTWNVLIDARGGFWVVDWDEVVFSPKERDLMFVVGGLGPGLVGPSDEAAFFRGYGETTVHPLALAYYRYLRAVEDIGAFGEEVYFMPERGDETKRTSADLLIGCFKPGAIIALAYEADQVIE